MSKVFEVACAHCHELTEVFDDDTEFNCPYCKQDNSLVFEDDENADDSEEPQEDEYTTSNVLVIDRSISMLWCSRHRVQTEHAWVSDTRFGQRLACLFCWPSKRPTHPLYHRKEE